MKESTAQKLSFEWLYTMVTSTDVNVNHIVWHFNSSTWMHCSNAFIWMVYRMVSSTDKWSYNKLFYYDLSEVCRNLAKKTADSLFWRHVFSPLVARVRFTLPSTFVLRARVFTFRITCQIHSTKQQLQRFPGNTQPTLPWWVPQVGLLTYLPVRIGPREWFPGLQHHCVTLRREHRRTTKGLASNVTATSGELWRLFLWQRLPTRIQAPHGSFPACTWSSPAYSLSGPDPLQPWLAVASVACWGVWGRGERRSKEDETKERDAKIELRIESETELDEGFGSTEPRRWTGNVCDFFSL